MRFHRINATDSKGFVTNVWRLDPNSANTVAARLMELGFTDVHVEPVDIPIGDAMKFKFWLNNNPNSPNIKDGTMQATEERTNVYPQGARFDSFRAMNEAMANAHTYPESATLTLDPADPRAANMAKPLVWPEVPADLSKTSALDVQPGGDHYKGRTIQPIEYIHANGLPFIEGNVVKYITRWRDKGGVKDLEKIKHYIDLLIELESREKTA